MRGIIGGLLIAFLVGVCNMSYAQVKMAEIQGRVLAGNQLPAESSTVVLLNYSDSSITKSTVVNKSGFFKFSNLTAGDYLLMVTKIGYNNVYSKRYKLIPGQTTTADDITITPATKQLQEVTVSGNKPPVEVQPGKIILNVQSSIIAAGSSAFDVLRQSPGVRVDNSNNISIIGRQNAMITIDGRPTNLTGEDLAAVLRSMPANTIDRIELITGGSAKYDASAGGIINIVSKKGNNVGANATVTATAGYGRYYKANAGVVFNDRTDKFNIFGNYNFAANKTFHDFTSDRTINFDGVVSDYNVDYDAVAISNSNNFGFGTDYYLTKSQTIGFFVNGSVIGSSITKNNNLKIYNQSVFDSTIVANSGVERHISRLNYNLNYNGKLDDAGKTLSANVNYNTYNRSSSEYITNNFYNADGSIYSEPLLLQNLSPSNIHIWLSKVDFTDPLSKNSKLEAGLKYSNVTSNNDLTFGPFVNGQYTSDPQISNDFIYTENVNAAYLNYEGKADKLSLEAGLRVEQTNSKGHSVTLNETVNSNYTNLFPHVLLTYAKDDKNEFSLDYNRGIQRPEYEKLNPFLNYVDLYDFTEGNPYLKPEYSNSVELSYTYNNAITATLYTNIVSDAYEFNFYEQNDTSKINVNTAKNLGRISNYGIRFFAPATFTKWWTANFNLDAAYQRYVSYPGNAYLDKGTQDIIFKTTQYFTLSSTLKAEISARYESPSFYGVNQYKSYYNMDAGISQQLFDKRGSLRLSATDIFNTLHDRSHTDYNGLNMTGTDKIESQVVRLTFTYRFGKSLKTISHHTGADEELKRITGAN